MSLRSVGVLAMSLAMLLSAANVAGAEQRRPDYSRPGWYLGAGGGAGFDFLEDYFEGATGGVLDITAAGSANVRGGYRLSSWFAFELMYEGVYNTKIELPGVATLADFSTHSFVGNLKLILPIRRVHPYFSIGPGAQYGEFNGHGPFEGLDTTRWDFMLRAGFGIDAYITENWLVNMEVAPSIRFADYANIPSKTTDNVTLTIGLGVQYRW